MQGPENRSTSCRLKHRPFGEVAQPVLQAKCPSRGVSCVSSTDNHVPRFHWRLRAGVGGGGKKNQTCDVWFLRRRPKYNFPLEQFDENVAAAVTVKVAADDEPVQKSGQTAARRRVFLSRSPARKGRTGHWPRHGLPAPPELGLRKTDRHGFARRVGCGRRGRPGPEWARAAVSVSHWRSFPEWSPCPNDACNRYRLAPG